MSQIKETGIFERKTWRIMERHWELVSYVYIIGIKTRHGFKTVEEVIRRINSEFYASQANKVYRTVRYFLQNF